MSIDTETGLPKRKLGRTGLEVTQLGFGTALRSSPDDVIDDDRVGRILNAVLDAGINFIDTAPDYGDSEERIGDYISHRRDQFYLATKCGCNIDAEGRRLEPGHLWTATEAATEHRSEFEANEDRLCRYSADAQPERRGGGGGRIDPRP